MGLPHPDLEVKSGRGRPAAGYKVNCIQLGISPYTCNLYLLWLCETNDCTTGHHWPVHLDGGSGH